MGGYPFASDPPFSGLHQPIFWTPITDPGAVLLEPRPASLGTPVADDDVLPHAVAGVDDQHGRLTVQDGHVNLTYLTQTDSERIVAVVILDAHTPARLHSLSRLWAALRHRHIHA